jgi:hypothetical protein
MRLYRLELKKPLTSEAVWRFVAICLLFNIYLAVSNSGDPYADFVGTISNDTGSVLGQPFHEKLARLLAGDGQAEYLARLKLETGNVTDVFDGYETADVGERYIAAAGATDRFAEAMRNKYSALQKVVYEKAAKDESLSLYFVGATYNRHQLLFGTLMGWLLIEGALISVLLVLLSTEYENIHKTENLVYSTKKDRRVLRSKFAASVSAGLGAFALLALATFLVHFSIHEYGSVWGSSVSSVFN